MKHPNLGTLVGLVTVFLIAGMAFAQGQGQGSQGAVPMMGCQQRFDSIDANYDGKISREEFMVHAEEMFKSMDANGDGVLVEDELTCCKGMGGCMGKGMGQCMGHRHGQSKGTLISQLIKRACEGTE